MMTSIIEEQQGQALSASQQIIEKIAAWGGLPASTAHQHRLMIFQATRRPKETEQTFTTAWGRVRIKGKLGAQHADLLEAIILAGERPAVTDENRIKLLVDPARVRSIQRQDGGTLKNTLDELMQALVHILEPEHLEGVGHLIDSVETARRRDGTVITRPNPPGSCAGPDRKLWRVDLGAPLCKMLNQDLRTHRTEEQVRRIAALRHGISQAVARHILSHKKGTCDTWRPETLIEAVAGKLAPAALRDRMDELASDIDLLAHIGVATPHLHQLKIELEARRGSINADRGSINADHGSINAGTGA